MLRLARLRLTMAVIAAVFLAELLPIMLDRPPESASRFMIRLGFLLAFCLLGYRRIREDLLGTDHFKILDSTKSK